MFWLQNAVEPIKVFLEREEDGFTRIPIASEEMEEGCSFTSETLIEVMRYLGNVHLEKPIMKQKLVNI